MYVPYKEHKNNNDFRMFVILGESSKLRTYKQSSVLTSKIRKLRIIILKLN